MNGLLIPAIIEGVSTRKDRTVKLIIGTNELPPAKAGELFTLQNSIVTIYLKSTEITQDEMKLVDTINPDLEGKSQSQRLRNVLFILWKQDNQGFDFEGFYQNKTETIINHLKNKII